MSPRPRWQMWLPLVLTAACSVLVAIIYDEIRRRPGASIADFAPADHSAAAPVLPADLAFAMPGEEAFVEALERPVFSPTRRAVRAPDSGMPALTSADFSLVGVVISPDERVALVKPRNGGELARLHEGDTLAGWLAVSIAPDRVVFRNGATEEEILLDYNVAAPELPAPGPEAETGSEQALSEENRELSTNGESQPEVQSGNEAPETYGASDP